MSNTIAKDYFQTLSELLLNMEVTDGDGAEITLEEGVSRASEKLVAVAPGSHKVMVIGNGGSAAIAAHMQNDLCKAVGIRAMVFNEPSLLTALSNDDGYETVFETPIRMWGEEGDILLSISSSGQSENILRGARAADSRGCTSITFSGFKPDNPLRKMGELNFYISSMTYGFVEVAHTALAHLLADQARTSLEETHNSSAR